jgi:hypothetical protein
VAGTVVEGLAEGRGVWHDPEVDGATGCCRASGGEEGAGLASRDAMSEEKETLRTTEDRTR